MHQAPACGMQLLCPGSSSLAFRGDAWDVFHELAAGAVKRKFAMMAATCPDLGNFWLRGCLPTACAPSTLDSGRGIALSIRCEPHLHETSLSPWVAMAARFRRWIRSLTVAGRSRGWARRRTKGVYVGGSNRCSPFTHCNHYCRSCVDRPEPVKRLTTRVSLSFSRYEVLYPACFSANSNPCAAR